MKQLKQILSSDQSLEANELLRQKRYLIVDVLRGFTVILMFIFHFTFDLNYFGFIKIDMLRSPFWYFLPRLIVFLFLFAVGMGLFLAHGHQIKWKSFNKRLLLISFWALVISLVTYKLFPENWIYFGTLHSIALVSLISLFFLKRPRLSLFITLLLFIPSIFWDYNLPWIELPHGSWDYISPFPWMGASLLGIFAAHKGLYKLNLNENKSIKSLNYLGQHSLFIYLIHQPLFFGSLFLVSKVLSQK